MLNITTLENGNKTSSNVLLLCLNKLLNNLCSLLTNTAHIHDATSHCDFSIAADSQGYTIFTWDTLLLFVKLHKRMITSNIMMAVCCYLR